MKKIILMIMIMVAITSNAVSAAEYWKYSTSGLMTSERELEHSYGWSSIFDPGAMVYADRSIFDKKEVTVMNYPVAEYSVYSSTTGPETLTLGIVESNSNIDNVVMNHINYIERIGGRMTGYSVDGDGVYNRCINISWDAAGMHHYARFEYELSPARVGYYDLMFTDYRSFDIGLMNSSFSVLGEYQR